MGYHLYFSCSYGVTHLYYKKKNKVKVVLGHLKKHKMMEIIWLLFYPNPLNISSFLVIGIFFWVSGPNLGRNVYRHSSCWLSAESWLLLLSVFVTYFFLELLILLLSFLPYLHSFFFSSPPRVGRIKIIFTLISLLLNYFFIFGLLFFIMYFLYQFLFLYSNSILFLY